MVCCFFYQIMCFSLVVLVSTVGLVTSYLLLSILFLESGTSLVTPLGFKPRTSRTGI